MNTKNDVDRNAPAGQTRIIGVPILDDQDCVLIGDFYDRELALNSAKDFNDGHSVGFDVLYCGIQCVYDDEGNCLYGEEIVKEITED